MYNDADLETLELEDASRWMFCSDCGDEVRRRDGETRCKRCSVTPPPAKLEDTTTYADEHECGQLRLGVPGEQVSLLPLPDKEIPQRCHICHHGAEEGHALSCPTRWY